MSGRRGGTRPPGRAGGGGPGGDSRRPSGVRGALEWLRKPWIWLVTTVVAALATVFSGWITAIPGQLADPKAAKDSIRSGPDFSVSTSMIREDDEGRSAVAPDDFRPTAPQLGLMSKPGAAATDKVQQLIRSAGGVNTEYLTLQLVLTGHRNQQINIVDIEPVFVRRTAPLAGTYFCIPSQGGVSTLSMMFDMDRPNPVARETDGGSPGKAFFAQKTVTLNDDEQQVLVVRAVTGHFYAEFKLRITYMLGDKKKSIVVGDDHGRPFQVTALNLRPGGSGTSYERVFSLQQDFSLCQSAGPGATDTTCKPC